jgi:hypothetical protein
MKKLKTIGMVLAIASMMFNSCSEKIETSALTLDQSKKATLKVNLYAELDYTTQGLEFAPNGTQVLVRIANNHFNPTATGHWTQIETIQNGVIQLEIPVNDQGVTVEIFPMEFIFDQVQVFGSVSSTIKKKFRFVGVAAETGVKTSEIRTHEATYTDMGAFDNFEETVTKKFELRADMDVTNSGLEYVPNGTNVTFYTNGWMTTGTVSAAGRIDVTMPKNENVRVRFQASKVVTNENGDPIVRIYLYDAHVGNYSESSPVLTVINCGGGNLWE